MISAIEKLPVFANEKVDSLSSLPHEITTIENELWSIRSVFKDADKKSEADDSVSEWQRQVRDIAYHVEHVIDGYPLLSKQQPSHRCGITSIV